MATSDSSAGNVVLIASRRGQAWKALIPLATLLAGYGGIAIWLDGLPLIVLLPLSLITALFATRFARWRRRGDIVDTGDALAYVRNGQVLSSAPWGQIQVVAFSANRRIPPHWSIEGQGVRGLTPLPCVWVRKTGDHNQFIYDPQFADIMLTKRAAIEAARDSLAAACARHGVTFDDAWNRVIG